MENKLKKVNIRGIENLCRKHTKLYSSNSSSIPIIRLPESSIEELKNELENTYEVTVHIYDNVNGFNFCIDKLNTTYSIKSLKIARGK